MNDADVIFLMQGEGKEYLCRSCGQFKLCDDHPPPSHCPNCNSTSLSWGQLGTLVEKGKEDASGWLLNNGVKYKPGKDDVALYLTCPKFTCCITTNNGVIVEPIPPILRSFTGQSVDRLLDWCKSRFGDYDIEPIKTEEVEEDG